MSCIKFAAVAALVLLQGLAQASSFAQACERELAPAEVVVNVNTQLPDIETRSTTLADATNAVHGTTDITRIAALGHTTATRNIAYEFGADILVDEKTGRQCARLAVDFELGYSTMVIEIARDFAPHSCGYREVMAHEMEHVRIFEQNLLTLKERVMRSLADMPALPVVYASSDEELARVLEAQVTDILMPRIVAVMDEVRAQHAELDSHEESNRVFNACDGEVRATLREALAALR